MFSKTSMYCLQFLKRLNVIKLKNKTITLYFMFLTSIHIYLYSTTSCILPEVNQIEVHRTLHRIHWSHRDQGHCEYILELTAVFVSSKTIIITKNTTMENIIFPSEVTRTITMIDMRELSPPLEPVSSQLNSGYFQTTS